MKNAPQRSRPLGKHLGMIIGIPLLSLLITILFFHSSGENYKDFMLSFAWSLAICSTQWIGNSYIYEWLDKKYSWNENLVKRAVWGSLSLIVYSALAFLAVQVIMYKLVLGSLPENPVAWGLRASYIAILISFIVSLTFVAVAFFRNWKKSLLEAERFKTEMLMYKYESLQNQINPHFLFNSFNVLSELVYEDQKKAVDFISQLSQLFRYVLDSRDKELVPLGEELEFIEAYAYLLQTRFEKKLSFTLDLNAHRGELIVPMTLQLLLENCVKHNEISEAKPLNIRISRKAEYLRIENGLQPKSQGTESKKLGLSNIMQQYRYFTDKPVLISQTEDHFSVEVPLIKSGER